MFVVINTASIQLIPTTIIALRAAQGSLNPGEIIVPIWIASLIATVVGVICVKLMGNRRSNKKSRPRVAGETHKVWRPNR